MFDQFEPELDSDEEGSDEEAFVEDDDGDEDDDDDSSRKRKAGSDGPLGRKKRRLSSEDGTQTVYLQQNFLMISNFPCRGRDACCKRNAMSTCSVWTNTICLERIMVKVHQVQYISWPLYLIVLTMISSGELTLHRPLCSADWLGLLSSVSPTNMVTPVSPVKNMKYFMPYTTMKCQG